MNQIDLEMMKKVLELARYGVGYVSPNPLVGAVIVKDGVVLGEGYHQKYGGPHAEVMAFTDAKKHGEDAVRGGTIYVNLEPCSHFGKTPPCADAIIAAGIEKVIVAMVDPNPKVAGQGIKRMQDAGLTVEVGLLEKEAQRLNEVFIHDMTQHKTFVAIKTAMTLDGKIATVTGASKWISCEASRQRVHELRQHYDGIMVGIGTVTADNPKLTTRRQAGTNRHPHRIIIDTHGRTPRDAAVLEPTAKTYIVVSKDLDNSKIEAFKSCGAKVLLVETKDNHIDLAQLLKVLYQEGIKSVLVEGGGTLNDSLLREGLVDKYYAFIAPKLFGGQDAKTPVEGKGILTVEEAIELDDMSFELSGTDIFVTAKVKYK